MSDDEQRSAQAEKAQSDKDERDQAQETMKRLESDPPDKLEDWPTDKAKYQTFGGGDEGESYDDGPTAKLGPSEVRHFDDGSVTVGGEEVDNADDFKGEPIPGGPTDPESPETHGEKVRKEKAERMEKLLPQFEGHGEDASGSGGDREDRDR